MEKEKGKTAKILADVIGKRNDVNTVKELATILFSNNDALDEKTSAEYVLALNAVKKFYQDCGYNNPLINLQYSLAINKIDRGLSEAIAKDDIITRYVAVLKLIGSGLLSGKKLTRNNCYIDSFYCYGIDALLGNCCCRHQLSLINDIISKSTDTVRLGVGPEENGPANHCVLAAYDGYLDKYLFLDSIRAFSYNPNPDNPFELIKPNGNKKYIKANCSYSYFPEFRNVEEMKSFFDNIKSYNLTKEECEELKYKITFASKVLMPLMKELLHDIGKSVEKEREFTKILLLR